MLKQSIISLTFLCVSARAMICSVANAEAAGQMSALEQGKTLAFTRAKGNCLACHIVAGGELMGNYGPPLIFMKERFSDRDALRAQIWDAAVNNPNTRMPPFGRNRILTEEEIDLVTDFIQSL